MTVCSFVVGTLSQKRLWWLGFYFIGFSHLTFCLLDDGWAGVDGMGVDVVCYLHILANLSVGLCTIYFNGILINLKQAHMFFLLVSLSFILI